MWECMCVIYRKNKWKKQSNNFDEGSREITADNAKN